MSNVINILQRQIRIDDIRGDLKRGIVIRVMEVDPITLMDGQTTSKKESGWQGVVPTSKGGDNLHIMSEAFPCVDGRQQVL